MDQVTQTKVLFRREQWKKIIAECQASGLPVKTWCDQNGFKEQSYYYYLKKIREQEIEKIPVALPDPMEKPVLFKKLEVQTPICLLRCDEIAVPEDWKSVVRNRKSYIA